MTEINLYSIFSHLTGDETFLSRVIEINQGEIQKKKSLKPNSFNLMANMVTDYFPLAPYETQSYTTFPSKIKQFFSPDYVRFGIKNVIEKKFYCSQYFIFI